MQKGVMFNFRLQGRALERIFENNYLELNDITVKLGFKTLDPDQES